MSNGYRLRMRDELERRYEQLRKQSIEIANQALRTPDIKVSLVDNSSYDAFNRWRNHPDRVVSWDWPTSWGLWKMEYPKRFECATWKSATWKGSNLIGFAMGKPTYQATGLRLDFIEKSPEANEPLLDITYVALYSYATLLGATYIKIMNPINKAVCDYYESKGFKFSKWEKGCIKRV